MSYMAQPRVHAGPVQPRAFGAGPLDGLLLRVRCVHAPDSPVDEHWDQDRYHLEYALLGTYRMPCRWDPDDTHAVGVSTDFVEADVIDDHYRINRGENIPVDDVDRAYWLIDTFFIDWADTCRVVTT